MYIQFPAPIVGTADLNQPLDKEAFSFRDYKTRRAQHQLSRPNRATRRKFWHDIKAAVHR